MFNTNPMQRVPIIPFLLVLWWYAQAPATAQDPAAHRLYAEAMRLQQSGDGDAARQELQLLARQFPGDRLAPTALLRVAEIQLAAGDLQTAGLALESLRSTYGRSLESASAFVMQGDIEILKARRPADIETARATFRRVPLLYGRKSYPDLEARVRARIRSGELSLRLGDDESAVGEFLAAVEDEPPGPSTGRARLLLATALIRRGEWLAATEVLQRLVSEEDASTEASGAPPSGGTYHLPPSGGTSHLPPSGGTSSGRTSTAADQAGAIRLLSLIQRRLVRPLSGQAQWRAASRYSTGGLQLREPSGVAAAEDGRLVVVDRRLKTVALIDPEGQVLQRAATAGGRPGWSAGVPYLAVETGISVPFDGPSPDSSASGGAISFLEPRAGKEKPLKSLLAGERGRFGDWLIIARNRKSVFRYENTRQGQALLAATRPEPVDLAQDHLGRVYVLDRDSSSILRLGVDRRQVETVLKGAWRRPVAIALDALGNLYVLDRGERTIEMFEPSGRRLAKLGPRLGGGIELSKPVDLAVDGSGRVFIADSDLPFVVMLD